MLFRSFIHNWPSDLISSLYKKSSKVITKICLHFVDILLFTVYLNWPPYLLGSEFPDGKGKEE